MTKHRYWTELAVVQPDVTAKQPPARLPESFLCPWLRPAERGVVAELGLGMRKEEADRGRDGESFLPAAPAPPHWAVRAATALAILFKVGSIALAVLSVMVLSYLGVTVSWGLAFGLPWILAYFYFIWICPAHQLAMGIRKMKPWRMVWWPLTTAAHILLILAVLGSYITPSPHYLHIDSSNLRPLACLTLVLAILVFFEVIVLYAVFLIHTERVQLAAQTQQQAGRREEQPSLSQQLLPAGPPPSYHEAVQDGGAGGGAADDGGSDKELLPVSGTGHGILYSYQYRTTLKTIF